MRTVLSIARNDLRRLYTNVMASIVMAGLIALPCLFAWFNVLATWDPFGNTERLRVAVANTDTGHTSELTPLSVNVGDMVLAELARNDDMDWVITTSADAVEGTRSGEYYAAIVLPPTLSDDMFTFYAGEARPSTIDLYVNEKKNPISPLLITTGTQGVSAHISDTFTRALSEVSFGLIDTASGFLSEADTRRALDTVESRTAATREQLISSASTVDALAALAESSVPIVAGAERLASASGESLEQIRPLDINGTAGGGSAAAALGAALGGTSSSFGAVDNAVDRLLSETDSTSEAAAASLTDIAARVDVQAAQYAGVRDQLRDGVAAALPPETRPAVTTAAAELDDVIARLTAVRDRLNDTAANLRANPAEADGSRQEIRDSISAARAAADDARAAFDGELAPRLADLSASLDRVAGSVATARGELGDVAAALSDSPGSLRGTLTSTAAGLRELAGSLRDNAATLEETQGAIAAARDTGDLSKLAALVRDRPEELANALADPIKVERTEVFPRASFGAGMAPLYTTLALWVGALLTSVALRTDDESVEHNVADPADVGPAAVFFGRYLTFAATGLAQSTLVVAGLIVYVEVDPVHPGLLFIAGWVTSLVFHLICYALVLSLSNAGKAIGVLLLVLQVSAAGGAYPLQLLPGWVRAVSPWLPATYSIRAMRAALFGTWDGDFLRALAILGAFTLPFLLLGLWLRHRLAGLVAEMDEAAARTRVMSGAGS